MSIKKLEPGLVELEEAWPAGWDRELKDLRLYARLGKFFVVTIDPSWGPPYRFDLYGRVPDDATIHTSYPRSKTAWSIKTSWGAWRESTADYEDWRDALVEARLILALALADLSAIVEIDGVVVERGEAEPSD